MKDNYLTAKLIKDEETLTFQDYFRKILMAPVYEVATQTPISLMTKLGKRFQNNIFLKREDLQPIHSFKIRGAYNKLTKLTQEQKSKGVVAVSAGNHAQGVALSATQLGIKSTIVMPITTPEIKVNAVKSRGGKVILHGKNYDEAQAKAKKLCEQMNALMIHPFDDPDVIIGQGTVARELLQQEQQLDAIFVPVGGGGLLAGMATYVKSLLPNIKMIGVEAEDSACLKKALATGKPANLSSVGNFADGVAVKRIGDETFRLIKECCDEVITVSSDEICASIKDIFDDVRAIAEPAGALSLAGLKKYLSMNNYKNKKVAAILSGANLNFDTLRYVSERTELGEQKEAVLTVDIDEKKGSYHKFCQALGGKIITEFNYRYSDEVRAHIFVGIRLREGQTELAQIKRSLTDHGYHFTDLSEDEMAKLHVRYMVGGKPKKQLEEKVFSFEFPEHPSSLMNFLDTLGEKWNITLFHYRNHGAAIGQVLAGFEIPDNEELAFHRHLKALGYKYKDETHNPSYQLFLK